MRFDVHRIPMGAFANLGDRIFGGTQKPCDLCVQQLWVGFDKISNRINDFFYGRYDIMCNSIEDLKAEKNFTILEFNGCGAEPNHFYDTGYTLIKAYKEILKHWKALYQISKYNQQQGIKPWPFAKGRKFLSDTKKYTARMKEADKDI